MLHKFLTVFSKFDWDKLCLSLQGPIPLSSFPDPKRERPPLSCCHLHWDPQERFRLTRTK